MERETISSEETLIISQDIDRLFGNSYLVGETSRSRHKIIFEVVDTVLILYESIVVSNRQL